MFMVSSLRTITFHMLVSVLIFKTCICLVQVNLFLCTFGIIIYSSHYNLYFYRDNSWLFLIKGETPFDTLERHKHRWVFKVLSFSVNSGCTFSKFLSHSLLLFQMLHQLSCSTVRLKMPYSDCWTQLMSNRTCIKWVNFFFTVLFVRFLSGNCDIISYLITVKEARQ